MMRPISLTRCLLPWILVLTACGPSDGVTPLMEAAKAGKAAEIRGLVGQGATLDERSRYGWTALVFAAHEGHQEAVLALLEAGADPALVTERIAVATTAPYPRTTALREAVRQGHVSVARLLLERGAPPDAEATALAAGLDDLDLLQEMHALGGPIDVPVDALYTRSALDTACRDGSLDNVIWLLDQGVDPSPGATGGFPLMTAVGADRPQVVQLLLERGADPDQVSPRGGHSALLHAATKHTGTARMERNLEVIGMLLDAGADPGFRSEGAQYGGKSAIEILQDERVKTLARIQANPYGEKQRQAEQRLLDHRDAIIERLKT